MKALAPHVHFLMTDEYGRRPDARRNVDRIKGTWQTHRSHCEDESLLREGKVRVNGKQKII